MNHVQLASLQRLLDYGQYDQAIDLLKRQLAADPEDVYSHGLLASAFISKGSLRQGEKALNMALSLDPNLPWLYLEYARLKVAKSR